MIRKISYTFTLLMTFQQLFSGSLSQCHLSNKELHNHPLYRSLRGSPRPNRTASAEACSSIAAEEPCAVSDIIFNTSVDARPAQSASSSSTSLYLSASSGSSSFSSHYESDEAQTEYSGRIADVVAIYKQIKNAKSRQHQELTQMLQKHSEEQHILLQRHSEEQSRLDESLQEAVENCSQEQSEEQSEMKQTKRFNALVKEFIKKQTEIVNSFSKRMRDDRASSDSEEAECDVSDALSESDESDSAASEEYDAPSAVAKGIRSWLVIQRELAKHRSSESKFELISEHLEALTKDGRIGEGDIHEKNYHRSLLEKTCILLDLCREGKAQLSEAAACFRNIDETLFETRTLPVYRSCCQELAAHQEQTKRQRTS